MELDETQKLAVARCCDMSVNNRLVAVTGGAGTGKTTILLTVYEMLTKAGYTVAISAPTGKAAKRVQEATGIHAQTNHRLLEFTHPGQKDPETGKVYGVAEPRRTKWNPLEYDVLLCDEYAMVTHKLHRYLLDATKQPSGAIRVFGDANQLQPIETSEAVAREPSPFKKILQSHSGVTLTTIHRQGEGSGIVYNGSRIISGQFPRKLPDFRVMITRQHVDEIKRLLETTAYNVIENQIITPGNKSWVGVGKLNPVIQMYYQRGNDKPSFNLPRHKWVKTPARIWPGDKVIWTENDYELEIFNGETGIVGDVTEYGEVVIDFGDRVVTVPPVKLVLNKKGEEVPVDPRKSIDLAYVITTHKAQGSEYNNVIYVMDDGLLYMVCRTNFYTAVTRARESVDVITSNRALNTSLARIMR